jgi:hypothetical protein
MAVIGPKWRQDLNRVRVMPWAVITSCSLRGVIRRLDHYLSRHVRVERAEILIASGLSEGEGEAVVGIERLRLEHPRRRGDRVRDIVFVAPSHRRSRFYGKVLRSEGEIIYLYHRSFGVGSAGRKKGSSRKGGDQESGAWRASTPFRE